MLSKLIVISMPFCYLFYTIITFQGKQLTALIKISSVYNEFTVILYLIPQDSCRLLAGL